MKKYYETEILKFLNEGEYSPLFCSDFLHFLLSNRCDIRQIGDEIKYLEGLSTKTFTKKQTKFKKGPLKSLWHKHFLLPKIFQKTV
ncbi:MAG: hypothetical protein MJ229_01845 [bacterium]|nr:hypothetical protein [bacterium]